MGFKVGDKVKWSSQSMGTHLKKHGTVLAVVPADTDPVMVLAGLSIREKFSTPKFGMSRRSESYLIVVGDGRFKQRRLYWPVASLLQSIDDED